jgi:pimeloyl-ACP methyl ester carboxylesterase
MDNTHILMMPGLGLSSKIFDKYTFSNAKVTKLEWIDPLKNEDILDYSKRLITQVDLNQKRIILIGQSFGGVVVQELSKIINAEKIILISSIKSESELPFKMNLLRQFKFYGILNRSIIANSFFFWARPYGYNTPESRKLFLTSIKNQSDYYFKWATKTIVTWKNPQKDYSKIIHFHGDRDRTFPIKRIENPIIIKGGDHLMVVKQAAEIEKGILKLISE